LFVAIDRATRVLYYQLSHQVLTKWGFVLLE
jgi:hypothetical protein